MRRLLFSLLLIACISMQPNVVQAQQTQVAQSIPLKVNKIYKGKSIKVDDGDTFTFLSKSKTPYKIRLDGIDAPEKGMPYAKKAKEYLAALLLCQDIEIRIVSIDRYGRYIAKVSCAHKDLSLVMLEAGYAWHYKQYNQEASLATAAEKARQQQTGLWQEKAPLAPWTVRAYRRAGYSDLEFQKLRKQNSPEIRRFIEAI
ncbi:MAG: hypothetical protein BGO31_16530 [Bacteroidetes bacterium 43-16]|nr:MAG: hypothetical protein BGO31_16530 [Bacteroidetes bacterium 43-16]